MISMLLPAGHCGPHPVQDLSVLRAVSEILQFKRIGLEIVELFFPGRLKPAPLLGIQLAVFKHLPQGLHHLHIVAIGEVVTAGLLGIPAANVLVTRVAYGPLSIHYRVHAIPARKHIPA